MAQASDLTVTASAVAAVQVLDKFDAPAAEAMDAGTAVRYNTDTGKISKANGSSAAEARMAGLLLNTVNAGEAGSVLRKGIADVGNALGDLTYDDDVYLSDTDGILCSNSADSTATKLAGTVVPGFAHTTADKLLRLDL